jgi:hypothetical protein
MDRELLLENRVRENCRLDGCRKLTNQVGDDRPERAAHGAAARGILAADLQHAAALDRPHRARPERQTDLEEVLNGPPVSASFGPDGAPTRAAEGFAAKARCHRSGVWSACRTAKGEYIAFRKRQRGRATIDVLARGARRHRCADSASRKRCTGTRPSRTGRGDLLFGRPIRWMLFLYGGRVVPFTIHAKFGARRRAGPGRADRRRSLRSPISDDERPGRPRHQGPLLR